MPNKIEEIAPPVEDRHPLFVAPRWLWLSLLSLVALGIRLIWVLHLPTDPHSLSALPDQLEYFQLARHWLETGTLRFHDARFDQDLYAYRMPGYPGFIALCGGSIQTVRLVQAGLDTSCVLAVFLLSRRWLTHRQWWIAPALVAFNPWLIYFSGLVLGETLFGALLAWGMVLLGMRRWSGGCVLLVAGVLIRPSAALLPTALALSSSVSARREPFSARATSNDDIADGAAKESGRRRLLAGSMSLSLTLVALLPWAARNHACLGSWIWLTTNGGITLYDGFNPSADGSSNQAFVGRSRESADMSEVRRDQFFQKRAVDFIHSHPGSAARLVIIKILRTWAPFPLSESYGSNIRYVIAGALFTIPLFGLTFIGLWRGSLTMSQRVFLLMPAIYITIVHGLTIGSLRYRIPADIPMTVIAASGIGRRAGLPRRSPAVG